jgi:hypothetical protein
MVKPSALQKLLGVILDQEMRFKEHATHALAKGTDWVMQFCRLSKPSAGMPARFARQLFNGIAVPKMLYAADIFCTPIYKAWGTKQMKGLVGFATKMARVQRLAALHVTGAMHTTATDMLNTHADLIPFQLLLNKSCHQATVRLASLPASHPLHPHIRRAA